jgi:predicted acetyltransferase
MVIQVVEIPTEQKPVLERLMQLYIYEFSESEGFDVNQDGLYEYKGAGVDSYWSEPDRHPFLIYVGEQIAGFVLVNCHTCLKENEGARSIAEFFVMRKYRRKAVGKRVAFHLFDKFPGKWEIRQMQTNAAGQAFWRSVIDEYMGDRFSEAVLNDDSWQGPIQSFDNSV